jgi:tetratricopeptide (TPR) repeat protein
LVFVFNAVHRGQPAFIRDWPGEIGDFRLSLASNLPTLVNWRRRCNRWVFARLARHFYGGFPGAAVMNDWNDAERRFEKALEFVQQRKWSDALEEMKAATTINPFNAGWFHNLGMILDQMNRCEEALDAYSRAAQIEPKNLPVQERLGIDLYRTGRLRQALRAFTRINAEDPAYESAYCHLILVHAELGDHEKAEEMFYTARLYKDHCPRCYDHIGRSLAARNEHDRAIYCFQRCLDLDPNWPAASGRLADCYRRKGDLEQARRFYLGDLRQNPGGIKTLLDLGDLLVQMNRLEEAGEKYRRCIELFPNQAGGYAGHGRWLVRCGRFDEARDCFAEALRLDPTLCGVHLELARLSLRHGDRAVTRRHLRAEHLRRSEDTHVLLSLANLWMDCGQDRTAMACLKRLIVLQPGNTDAWLNLAVAQFRRGLYTQGIQSCRQCLDLDGSNRLAMYNLALAYDHLGQFDQALQWTRRALTLEPRDVSLQRLELRLRLLRAGGLVLGWLRRRI